MRLGLWWHRVRHPVATVKAIAATVLPFRVRRTILRVIGRGRDRGQFVAGSTGGALGAGASVHFGDSPARPTIIFLSVIDWELRVQRPHHLLGRLAARGWPVLYAGTELEGGGGGVVFVDPEPQAPGVHEVLLPASRSRRVGEERLASGDIRMAADAIRKLVASHRIDSAIVLCQSPGWRPLAEILRREHGWPIVYDRIDLHEGFSTTARSVGEDDNRLVSEADLVTATAARLAEVERPTRRPVLRLPNGCDPEHWRRVDTAGELQELPRPIVGYFGAISEWFDVGLVESLAVARPDWSFVLIGSTWGADVTRLEVLPNVHLLGERKYSELPSLASAFDVGMIPFKRTPLTEATDPVKLYEMLALGLEVVAPSLPEIARLEQLVRLADDIETFLRELDQAVVGESISVAERRSFAVENSWEARVEVLERAMVELFPSVTIGIVTFNNRKLTELCLASIESQTIHPNYEVVVVDNASTDGTAAWLGDEVARRPGHRVILNDDNRGFAAACNQAFAGCESEILCFLNNDTIVSRGWLSTLTEALMGSPELGLVGPSSGGVANEARVEPGYQDLGELEDWAADFVWNHRGEDFSIPMLALYCAALRRTVWEEVGGLDERFEVGLFEDDDFSRRIRRAGYDVRCRRDAWVHHFQEASFGKLPPEAYERIYEANRRRFHAKRRSDSAEGE